MAKKTQENIDTSYKTQEKIAASLKDIEQKLREIEEERAELSKDAVANAERLRDLGYEEAKQQRTRLKLEEAIGDLTEKRTHDYEDLESLSRKFEKSLEAQKRSWEKLSPDAKSFSGTIDRSVLLMTQMDKTLKANVDLHKEQGSLSSEYQTTMKQSTDYLSLHNSLQSQMLDQVDQAVVGEYKSVDASQQKKMLEEAIGHLKDNRNKMSVKEISLAETTIAAMQESYDQIVAMNDALNETSKDAKAVLGTFDSMMKLDLRGAIRSWFKLDEINNDIKKNLRGSLANVVKEFRGEGGLVGGLKAAGSALKNMVSMAPKLALGLGIGAIAAGLGMLVKAAMHADEEIANMGKELGVSRHEASELHGATKRIAGEMNVVGLNAKEVYEGVKIVGDVMGGIDVASQLAAGNKELEGFVKQASLLSKQFGLSAAEIGNIKDISTITGKSMDALVKESVELGSGTMTAKQTMQVLSTIPPKVAVAFKGGTKELIAAAQKAKLLGMELGRVQDIGMGMLDIESSLQKEMEARVLTGKNLNLDAARQYALNGDIVSLQDELLTQAGSLDEFSSMGPIQQKAMADAIGMSVEEMTKMLTNAEKLRKAKIDTNMQDKLAKMNAKELRDMAKGAANDAQRDYILQIAKEKESASIKEKMADIMNKISEKLSPIVEEVVELAQGFFDGAKGVSQFDKIIESIDVASIVESVKKIIPVVIKFVTMLIEKLPSIIQFFTDVVDKFTSISSMINPGIAGFGILALKVGGPGGIAAGFKLAGSGAMGLFNLVKGPLSDGIGKLAGSVTGKLGGAFGKVTNKAKSGLLGGVMGKMGKVKTPKIPGIGDGAEKSVGKLSALTDKATSLGDKIKGFGKGLGGALKSLGKGVGAAIKGVFRGVAGGIQILGRALATMTPIGPVVAVTSLFFIALGVALLLASPALKAIAPVLIKFAEVLGTVLVEAIKVAGPILMEFVKVIGTVLVEALKQAGPIITSIFEGIATVVKAVGTAISGIIITIADSIIRLAEIDGSKLYVTAGGIAAMAAAIGLLGAGKAAEGFGSFVGSLFGGGDDPMDKLISFTERIKPEKLAETANGLKALTSTFSSFSTALETMATAIDKLNMDKLDSVIEKLEEAKSLNELSIGEGIASAAQSFVGGISSIFGSSEKQTTQPVTAGGAGSVAVAASGGGGTNMANVEKKLDTLISVISQAANQPLVIKFGEKTVEEIRTQLNFKKATNIGVDKGYGKTI
jgi:hypothetical protein